MNEQEVGNDQVKIVVPRELPVLTPSLSRILLRLLRELTEVEALDPPTERGPP